MERKKVTIRIKKNIYERFLLLVEENRTCIQEMFDEIIELGLLEKMKGGLSNNERLYKRRDRDIKE